MTQDMTVALLSAITREAQRISKSSGLGIISPVDGHLCDYLSKHGTQIPLTTVSRTNLQDNAGHCSVCRLLLQVTDAYLTSTHREHARITLTGGYPHDNFFVSGVSANDSSVIHSNAFYFFTRSDFLAIEDLPFRALCDTESIGRDTSSDTSLTWAKRQLSICDTTHDCLASTMGSPLPTRILDVSFKGSGDSVRLSITARQPERYVCLSHCWGEEASTTLKTTTSSLKAHTKGIAIAELPRTFRDAVDITRRLGIDYLWIDSLCIVQDSEDDWKDEASRMADIYEGAYVTIAATASRNSSEGCYRSSPPLMLEMDFPFATKTEPLTNLYCRQRFSHFDLNHEVPSQTKEIDFPLLERAWVFQERALSPRMLHFCNFELVFECRVSGCCQCGDATSSYGYKEDLARLFANGPDLQAFRASRGWWAVVRRYTRLKLTYDKDLLTALSGISRRVGASKPVADYIAGIWKTTLPYGLLWRVTLQRHVLKSPEDESRRADSPRAPSWSWASVVAPISWQLPHPLSSKKTLVIIHHISCEVSGKDNYGQVCGGIMRATGPVLTSKLSWKTSLQSLGNHLDNYDFSFSALSDRLLSTFYPDYPFFMDEASPLEVSCLWVSRATALVLRSTGGTDTFERIGLLKLTSLDGDYFEGEEPEWLEKSTQRVVEIV